MVESTTTTTVEVTYDENKYYGAIKDYEGFENLNKTFKDYLQKSAEFIDRNYENILINKKKITSNINAAVTDKYNEITNNFENTVKEVNTKIDTLKLSDPKSKEEFKRIKKSLDDQTDFLDNEEALNNEFKKIIEKADKRFKVIKLPELCKEELKFNIGKSNLSLDWINYNAPVVTTTTGKSGSYWCVKSQETIEGPLFCRIRIINIDSSKVGSYWSYGFGIVKPDSTDDGSYYNGGIILQSNGWLAQKFSGSGSHRQIFFENWKNGDEIMVKRDENNNVFFAYNSETNFVLAYDSITGPFRIILGFSTSSSNDSFEMIDLDG